MSLIFRKIDNRRRWDKIEGASWLGPSDVQADILFDLGTDKNALSIYMIEDESASLQRLLAAYAANRKYITKLDYAIFEGQLLTELGLELSARKGETRDSVVNDWHRDVINLSAQKVVSLGTAMHQRGRVERCQEKKVADLLAHAIRTKTIDKSKITPETAGKLRKLGLLEKEGPQSTPET